MSVKAEVRRLEEIEKATAVSAYERLKEMGYDSNGRPARSLGKSLRFVVRLEKGRGPDKQPRKRRVRYKVEGSPDAPIHGTVIGPSHKGEGWVKVREYIPTARGGASRIHHLEEKHLTEE